MNAYKSKAFNTNIKTFYMYLHSIVPIILKLFNCKVRQKNLTLFYPYVTLQTDKQTQ